MHHVGVVVADFDAVRSVFSSLLGATTGPPEIYPDLGIEVLWVDAGGTPLEFIRPLGPDSAAAAVLAAGGAGVHHVALEVDDLDAALRSAAAAGLGLRDAHPRPGTHGSRIAFLQPEAAGGALVELIEPRAPRHP